MNQNLPDIFRNLMILPRWINIGCDIGKLFGIHIIVECLTYNMKNTIHILQKITSKIVIDSLWLAIVYSNLLFYDIYK